MIKQLTSLQQSILIHMSFVILVLIVMGLPERAKMNTKKIEFEVFQIPQAAPVVQVPTEAPPATLPPVKRKAVFGVSRQSLQASSEMTAGAEIKAGNTVAKEQDQEVLDADDEGSLPIPVDEFLVSQMPSVLQEVRIPYPPEARKAGVEGPVVMDLLIDSNGDVRQVILVSGPGFGLNEAAVEAVRRMKFRPAKIKDQDVSVKIRYTYRFSLED